MIGKEKNAGAPDTVMAEKKAPKKKVASDE